MIRSIRIENFKSVRDAKLDLGRVNVFIGENGCGKSNLLEAIAFCAAGLSDKLDNEFLASRGIRVTDAKFMRSAFEGNALAEVRIAFEDEDVGPVLLSIDEDNADSYPTWKATLHSSIADAAEPAAPGSAAEALSKVDVRPGDPQSSREVERALRVLFKSRPERLIVPDGSITREDWEIFLAQLHARSLEDRHARVSASILSRFLIYSPENTSLRTFEREGQILPLGIRGEGLFKLLRVLSTHADRARWDDLRTNLRLLDWFDDLTVPTGLAPFEQALQIKDRFIPGEGAGGFDQRSSNEGFLFLLFYFALFVSSDTPAFFAVDNVDTSLNPKVCRELVRRLAGLSARYGKQVIFTTHNPAVLDGLNLHDDEQRLFVISRNRHGHTRARRVPAPEVIEGAPAITLSEAFLRGLLGGLPQNF